jgi:hypothetical protein
MSLEERAQAYKAIMRATLSKVDGTSQIHEKQNKKQNKTKHIYIMIDPRVD